MKLLVTTVVFITLQKSCDIFNFPSMTNTGNTLKG